MEGVEQQIALAERGIQPRERASYWRAERFGGLECLAARFVTHRYAPHTHDTYVVGAIVAGCETFMVNGTRQYANAGDVCFVHPGEVHDGEPYGDAYVYRMSYPGVELVREVAGELVGRDVKATPRFSATTIPDREAASRFTEAHRMLGEDEKLAGEERFLAALGLLLYRHGDVGAPLRLGREAGPVARARDYMEAHLAEDMELATLASVARLSRFHLIRAFRRETGLTPIAWLTDRRVRAARGMLAMGVTPGQVAAACGFADQSHLTRAFKARVGVTPGRFRAACLADAA